jgi:sulfatase modifying factor 1
VTESGPQLLGIVATVAVFGALLTARCGGKPLDGDTASLTDSHDSEPGGGCIEESGETEPPQESGETDPGGETSDPVDSTPPPETGLVEGCPVGMTSIGDAFCIDRWEASRPDATFTSIGSDERFATSRADVMPWKLTELGEARAACEAAGKRLCTEDEWYTTCIGPGETVYSYGDIYEPTTCNGIDSDCDCHGGSSETCACDEHGGPYAGCYYDCGGSYGMEPTGSRSGCSNSYGVWDINGNLWEYVDSGAEYPVRGGAYNCGDSQSFHRCDYVPGWNPSARGFRCCHDGVF